MTKDEALRLALEALEYYHSFEDYFRTPASTTITAIKAALEAKDEPVAWVRWDEEENYYDVRRTQPPQEAIEYLAKWNRPAWVSAYPTQPQRKPLTDEEIVETFCKAPHQTQYVAWFAAGVRYSEAAHGIKGEA